MASVFNLTRNAVAVNLISGVDAGWRSTRWRPNVAATTGNRMPPLVSETVNFIVDENTHNSLSTAFQDLDNYRWLAREYIQDRTQEHPVWLHAKMDNETGERRALVYDIGLRWLVDEVDEDGQWICQGDALATATITRGPFWERTAATAVSTANNLTVPVGTFDYTVGGGADVVGDAPARVNHLRIYGLAGGGGYGYGWMGFRSANKHPALANFQPLWELESGTAGTDTALAADATASPGGGGNTKMTCTFGVVTGWGSDTQWRVRIQSDDVIPGTEDDNYGRYVVLLRAKIVGSGTAEVQLKYGYYGNTDDYAYLFEGPIVEIDNTNWAMYEVGTVTMPVRDLHGMATSVRAGTFDDIHYYIYARQTSGAIDLDMDCLVFIPCDELFIGLKNMINDGTQETSVAQGPKNIWAAHKIHTANAEIVGTCQINIEGLGVPIGDGRMYATFGLLNVITQTWDVQLSHYPRWYNLRGTE